MIYTVRKKGTIKHSSADLEKAATAFMVAADLKPDDGIRKSVENVVIKDGYFYYDGVTIEAKP